MNIPTLGQGDSWFNPLKVMRRKSKPKPATIGIGQYLHVADNKVYLTEKAVKDMDPPKPPPQKTVLIQYNYKLPFTKRTIPVKFKVTPEQAEKLVQIKRHPASLKSPPDLPDDLSQMPEGEDTNPLLKWGLIGGGVLASIVLLQG